MTQKIVGVANAGARSTVILPSHPDVREILDKLKQNGFKAYVAGGAVRDAMLGRPCHDIDILTDAGLEKIRSLFLSRKVKIAGSRFPVCLVDGIEVATARGENDPAKFPESDLALRDFTFNAMAYDPVEKKILDPFNGRQDLKNAIIRFTKDPEGRIKEDPVRMVRACRFAAMLDGDLSPGSLEAVAALKDLLDAEAKERIKDEVLKAMTLERPSLFFIALKKNNLLEKIFPSLERCYTLDGGLFHAETVFEHCMLVGDALSPSRPLLRLAGFLHDTGKFDAARIKEGVLSFPGHEKHFAAMEKDLENLRFSAEQTGYIRSVVQAHMRPLTPKTTPRAARRLLAMLAEKNLDYTDFMRVRIADKKGNVAKPSYNLSDVKLRLKILYNEMNPDTCLNPDALLLSGNDIMKIRGIGPGPEVGQIKAMLFEKVLDDPKLNTREILAKICRSLKIEK